MDPTRLSIARLLALDVPLEWQEAVAVAQEVAMLSDVHAAMNSRPSLVSPEHCYITRSGSVELPETTDAESPDAVADILRALLAGRDAPEALEDLAYGRHPRDMSGELAAFPVGNRRALIAKLATRALNALNSEPTAVFDVPTMPGTAPAESPADSRSSGAATTIASGGADKAFPPAAAHEAMAAARETLRPVLVTSSAGRPPYVAASARATAEPLAPPFMTPPPFVATPQPALDPAVPAPGATPATSAPDLELRRIRRRNAQRARAPRKWRDRLAALVTWRPSFPDPRIIGATVIIIAAIGSVIWQGNRPNPPPAQTPRRAAPAAPAAPAGDKVVITVPSVASPPTVKDVEIRLPAPATTGAAPSVTIRTTPAPPGRANAPAVTLSASGRADAGRTAAAVTVSPGGRADAGKTAAPPVSVTAAATPPRNDASPRDVRRDDAPPPSTAASSTPAAIPPPRRVDGDASRRADPDEPRRAERDEASRVVADSVLYSSSNADVLPPVMRRQQLPSSLLAPSAEVPDDWPFLELLVDQQGAVEQVRLHARQLAPGQTLYRHRMLLAAAKAWQFEPARRNGSAVRYVMRVPLEP